MSDIYSKSLKNTIVVVKSPQSTPPFTIWNQRDYISFTTYLRSSKYGSDNHFFYFQFVEDIYHKFEFAMWQEKQNLEFLEICFSKIHLYFTNQNRSWETERVYCISARSYEIPPSFSKNTLLDHQNLSSKTVTKSGKTKYLISGNMVLKD